jgi:SAM-dependent methyltransferase
MTENSLHGKKEVLEGYRSRELGSKCPPLRTYLHPGATVLDVGCSAGSMTMDVAQMVHPGSVVGIDPLENAIEEARRLAEARQVENVTFQVGDSYHLGFDDETFDLTYSLAVLVWLRDPIRALKEQKRVTRKGGRVAASIGDYGTIVIYPPCPALEEVIAALTYLNDPSDEGAFVNFNLGRQALALFSQAGFEETRLEGYVAHAEQAYAGSAYFQDSYQLFGLMSDPGRPGARRLSKLIDLGVLDKATVLTAQEEVEAWYRHPHAFQMSATVFAAGRVP